MEDIVPYELAKALEKAGYNRIHEVFGDQVMYRDRGLTKGNEGAIEYFKSHDCELVIAPTYDQVFRWLRLEHKIEKDIHSHTHGRGEFRDYHYKIWNFQGERWEMDKRDGKDTWEEAREECLRHCIAIITRTNLRS